MEKILITGGAGYIGSVLTPALLEAGYAVTVLDNFIFRQTGLTQNCLHPHFEVVLGDARDKDTLSTLVKDADVVIPLAALVGAPLCDRDKVSTVTTNQEAVKTLVDLLSPNQRILMPVSNSGYGIGEKGKFCTEDSPLRPISLYGRTKVEAEKIVLDRGNCLTFRLATVFGMSPRMRMDLLVNDFVYRACKDRCVVLFESEFKRNYIHIRDIARVFLHGLKEFESMKSEPYNVGLSDANLSKKELCEEIKKQVPDFVFLDAPIGEDPDKRDYIVSNEKVEATGFMPKYSLQDGIGELVKGYRFLFPNQFANV